MSCFFTLLALTQNSKGISLNQFRLDGSFNVISSPFDEFYQPLAGKVTEIFGKLVHGCNRSQTLVFFHETETCDGYVLRNGNSLLLKIEKQAHCNIV